MHSATINATGKPLGEHNGRSKLSYEKVAEIRRLRQCSGVPYRTLGAMFGVDHKTVRNAAIGATWAPTITKETISADEQDLDRIRALVAQGLGLKKTAKSLGVNAISVRRMVKKHGIRTLHARGGK